MVATPNGVDAGVLDKIFEKGATSRPPIDCPDGSLAVVIPQGYDLHTIPPLEKLLPRIRQQVHLHDADSFIAYINQFKGEATRLFATPGQLASDKRAVITALVDYHEPGQPAYVAHAAHYKPRYSEQWQAWGKVNSLPMAQAEFGDFIEENARDVRKPEAASLLDIINEFKATKKVDFNSVTRQTNGDVKIGWDETTEYKGRAMTVPTELILGMPVFFSGPLYEVKALLRYRVADGKVMFVIKLDSPALIEQAAFEAIIKAVYQETEVSIFHGLAPTAG